MNLNIPIDRQDVEYPEKEDDSLCECGGRLEEEMWWVEGEPDRPTGDLICEDCGERYKSLR